MKGKKKKVDQQNSANLKIMANDKKVDTDFRPKNDLETDSMQSHTMLNVLFKQN